MLLKQIPNRDGLLDTGRRLYLLFPAVLSQLSGLSDVRPSGQHLSCHGHLHRKHTGSEVQVTSLKDLKWISKKSDTLVLAGWRCYIIASGFQLPDPVFFIARSCPSILFQLFFCFHAYRKEVAVKEIKMRKESRQESSEYFFLCQLCPRSQL